MAEIVLAVVLAVHLLLVDTAMASPLVCVWLEWRETRRGDRVAGQIGRRLAVAANQALAAGIGLGGLLLAMRASLGERDYLSAWNAIPASRLRFGLGELLFFFACMSAYRAWWDRLRNWRSIHRLLAIAAASNLFLHFPTLFAIVSVLATRHGTWAEPLDRSGYWQLLVDPEVMSRVVHVWLAALAVSGVVLMALATRLPEEPAGQADRRRLVGRGAWLALVPTLLQIPAGIWLAFELPETSRLPLLGGDLVATGLFVAAMLLALYLMHALASIALGDHEPKRVRHAVAVLCVLVVLMVGTRSRIDSSAAVPGASLSGLHRAKVAFQ